LDSAISAMMPKNKLFKFLKGFVNAIIVMFAYFVLVGLASLISPDAGHAAAFILFVAGFWGFLSTTLP
jgi:hypothetical protein